jgi:hypothetical protein
MRDDELEVWRRQWHGQPAVPIDLIRKVERQTMYMQLDWIAQILPGLIGVATVVAAIVMRSWTWVLLACGTWLFNIVGWWFMIRNTEGMWTPVAQTTAAYIELSIERCRRKLINFRFTTRFTVFLTAFVIAVLSLILGSMGAVKTNKDFVQTVLAFLFAIGVVSIFLLLEARKRKKTEAELTYLLELQRRLRDSR